MASTAINVDAYSDALVVLATAGVVVPLVHRWRVSPVLAYLAAGAVLGPLGLGAFQIAVPLLHWITVVDTRNVAGIAELGVVFLLFLIGIELTLERLLTMRRLVFGLGSLQFLLSALLLSFTAAELGAKPAAAVIMGACLALSSTAIVIEVISHQRRLATATGRVSFSVLLFQDLAVVPILLLISILGANIEGSLILGITLALGQAMLAVVLIVVVGRLALRPLFRLVAGAEASERFVAATLFVVVATGVAAGLAGLSMALGAFITGLLLAETEYRKVIETTIEPFKSLLLGLFFFTVGMGLDFRELARDPLWLLAAVAGLIAVKAGILALLARLFRVAWPAALETGLLLGPGGEFAFVGIGSAAAAGLITAGASSFLLTVTSLTMVLIPLMSRLARSLASQSEAQKALDGELATPPPLPGLKGRAIVVGHGRFGQMVCSMLEEHKFPFIATDRDPEAVRHWRRRGREVYFGDATIPAFLNSCGLPEAAAVIVTIHTQDSIDGIVKVVRSLRPDVLIVSRARDATHARHLYGIGVTDAVPETIEASLQLSEAALVGLGLPTGPVIASIHARRDIFRHELQEAAGQAGREGTHAVRAKTLPAS
jgi:monovalent cation:H+ antiporter-2, CPA2 family